MTDEVIARTTVWHIYECPPIAGREGVARVEEHLAILAQRGAGAVDSFVLRFEAAEELVANLTTWEGDGTWVVAKPPDVASALV